MGRLDRATAASVGLRTPPQSKTRKERRRERLLELAKDCRDMRELAEKWGTSRVMIYEIAYRCGLTVDDLGLRVAPKRTDSAYREFLQSTTRQYLLSQARHCRSAVELSQRIGVNRTDLYKLLERHGLTTDDFREHFPEWRYYPETFWRCQSDEDAALFRRFLCTGS